MTPRSAPFTASHAVLLHATAICAAIALSGAPANGAESHAPQPQPPVGKASAKGDVTAPANAAQQPTGRASDPMEQLRERLAEKLGATRPPDSRHPSLVRVSSKLEAPGSKPAPAPAAVPRKPHATVLAAVEAHRSTKPSATAADTAAHVAEPAPTAHGHAHWAYNGETGPGAWGALKPEFSLCAKGQRQSPIDIRGGIAVELDPVQFDYRASGFGVVDNGHTVQVNIAPGNSIQVGGRRFELVQFHFHRPSEERIDGRQFDMSLHLVHKDAEGRLAVVGLLLERGAPQPMVQRVWNNLPLEKHEEQGASTVLDLEHLLPPDRGYYTYMGSLTTPPCSEGVLWMVMRQPVTVSPAQIDIFARLYPMNARPIQSAAGRMIKQSQ